MSESGDEKASTATFNITVQRINLDSENSRTEEKKLLRKIDLRVLPMLSLLFALSLIDRTNIAAAKISGMQKDLELFGNRYSIALLAFFPTFIISEIPSNIIIRRVGTRYYLAFLILCWGVISMCHAFVKTFGQLVTLRVLLGLFEGGFTPACIYIISSWYKRYETQQRISVWFMIGSVGAGFNGVISYGLSTLEGLGGLRGWRWIFLIPGAITIVMAIPIFFLVTDFPEKAKWLTKHELDMVLQRLEDDKGESSEDKLTFKKAVAALSDWKVWLIASSLFFITTSTYTMVFFTPSILKSLGFSVALSQILVTPPYIFATIVSIGTAIWADRSRKRSPFIIGSLILTIAGFLMIGWGENTATRLIGIFFAHTGTSCATPAALTFLTNNIVGQSKRQMAIPIQTIYGGLGGIVGSLIFREQDAPGYRPGISTAATALGVCILTTAGITVYFRAQNKKADEQGKIIEGVEGFRYTL